MVVGADYQQVAPIGGGSMAKDLCERIKTISLTVVHRTDDPELLKFLETARKKQPTRSIVRELFGDRLLQVPSEEVPAKPRQSFTQPMLPRKPVVVF